MAASARYMNEKPEDKNSLDLSALDFGPAWAREGEGKTKKNYKDYEPRGAGSRKPFKGKGGRPQHGEGRKFDRGDKRRGKFDGKKGGRPPRPAFVQAPEGVSAEIMPIEAGVDNMAKEISAAGRTYSVFELAHVVLGARERFHIVFRKEEGAEDLLQCKKDHSVYLTKEECVAHFLVSDWKSEFYEEEEVEAEPPTGSFQAIAKCGLSGEILGPPNYHAYTHNVLELHRTRFAHMDLERYKSRIQTVRSEEAVSEWLESMKKKTQYKVVGEEGVVLDDPLAVTKHFQEKHFDEVFRATHRADVPSDIPAKLLSPGLLTLLKETVADQRRYPGKLASFLCRQLSGRHLAVFKWQGKLHCGPSRPHVVPEETTIADRPKQMLDWVQANPGGGVDQLWKDVLPEGVSEEAKKEWYHDLHWLLNQGYVVLMSDGHLYDSALSKEKPKAKKVKSAKGGATKRSKPAEPESSEEVKSEPVAKEPADKQSEVPASDSKEIAEEVKTEGSEAEEA
ncbi:hypothetical protein Rhal01_00731 [Rubritalea halochordaticola]|uniref:Uncharacterized protein n=1 Tax=Rubritalea halochordaticola TaxID=714537 RepID=A0ABP9UYY7_9BACT